MADQIVFGGPVPIYKQLAAILRNQIAAGTIPVGKPIPSKRELMHRYQVGEHTAHRAIKVLKEEGLAETTLGLGVFVIAKPR